MELFKKSGYTFKTTKYQFTWVLNPSRIFLGAPTLKVVELTYYFANCLPKTAWNKNAFQKDVYRPLIDHISVSRCIPRMPPRATMHTPLEQPHMPPRSNHAHPPGATMHAPLGATTHAPQAQPHTHPQSNHARPPGSNHACPLGATTHAPQEQPHTPPRATMHAPSGATTHAPQEQPHTPQSNHACPPGSNHTCPPVNRMTNRCKNITLPQTSFAAGNERIRTPGRVPGAPLDPPMPVPWPFFWCKAWLLNCIVFQKVMTQFYHTEISQSIFLVMIKYNLLKLKEIFWF